MELTSTHIYNSMIYGAYNIIKNKEVLNKINVFPINDGDTGSNLSSMMKTVIQKSSKEQSVKKTIASIAESALYGARGNSGIIFASYLGGLSESVKDLDVITVKEYAVASNQAFDVAYKSIEEPVEGTILTIMREWGEALLEESNKNNKIKDVFQHAFQKVEKALDNTKRQLEVLKKANVVDSGAKGFTYFVEGALYYIQTGKEADLAKFDLEESNRFEEIEFEHTMEDGKYRYCTECLLKSDALNEGEITSFLKENGDSIVLASNANIIRIHIHTDQPAKVFDFLHEKGRIEYQKVDDMRKQNEMLSNRKARIALVTDSIADLPKNFVDDHQIHVVHLDILYQDRIYMDKMTIENKRILELAKESKKLPTSSQVKPKQVENLFDYLSSYYDSAIVMTVSKELSGTYHVFERCARKYKGKDFPISVLNSRQNSAAEGLLVKRCAELISSHKSHDVVVEEMEELILGSKILVQVHTLDNMIKSGRLSLRAGKIAKAIGMKPIITLDQDGKGVLEGISFSNRGSLRKICSHINKMKRSKSIREYSIVHVNNIEGAMHLSKKMEEILGFGPSYIDETSSIVAIGAGSGAVAVAYLLDKGDL